VLSISGSDQTARTVWVKMTAILLKASDYESSAQVRRGVDKEATGYEGWTR
jgi:hypothetical protein